MKIQRAAAAKGFFEHTMASKTARTLVLQGVYFLAGILVSGGAVFGSYAPFGASMVAAVPFRNLLSSLAGTALGYIMFSPGGSFRYVATVLAVSAIRWTLSDLQKINRSRFFAPVISFIPMLATGLVLAAVGSFAGNLLAMCLIEALLCAVGAYFFNRTITLSAGSRGITTFNQQEIACIAMTGCILLLAFSSISVAGISLGRVAAVLAILFCARYGAVSGGCISGVATGRHIQYDGQLPELCRGRVRLWRPDGGAVCADRKNRDDSCVPCVQYRHGVPVTEHDPDSDLGL